MELRLRSEALLVTNKYTLRLSAYTTKKKETMKTTLLILLAILASCSTAWHYGKIESKDPNFWTQFNDTIQTPYIVWDTVRDVNDSLIYVPVIEYKDSIIEVDRINPKTRFDYKAQRDQLRHELKLEKERTKQLAIENRTFREKLKQENRTERTVTRQTNRTERTETRKEHRSARTLLLCLISFVVGCLMGMAFMFKYRMNVLRWLRGF